MNQIPVTQEDPNCIVKLHETERISAWVVSGNQRLISSVLLSFVKKWILLLHMAKLSLPSDINSVYDPIGLISPVLLVAKSSFNNFGV